MGAVLFNRHILDHDFWVVVFPLWLVLFLSLWNIFTKAHQPGWLILVPFLNAYYLIRIAGIPAVWILFFLVPGVNLIVFAVISIHLARRFGKDDNFGWGLFFLPFIFYPILAFGKSKWSTR